MSQEPATSNLATRLPGSVEMMAAPKDAVATRHMVLIDAMIAWIIGNPGKPLSHCALALSLSPNWVRAVASTDMFKARLAEKSDSMIAEVGLMTLKDKIKFAAEQGVERLTEKLLVAENMDQIKDATEMLLSKHFEMTGVGGQQGTGGQTVNVNLAVIQEAREKMLHPPSEPPAIEGEKAE